MEMEIALVLGGLVILLVSGDLLIRGAVGLAQAFHIPPLVIGLTIVAFGTSAPELVVTINAVFSDAAGVAIGNIIGSNIANVLLVLGAPALIYPIVCDSPGLRRNATIMLLATAMFSAYAYQGQTIDLARGLSLFMALIAFLVFTGLLLATGKVKDALAEELIDMEETAAQSLWKIVPFILLGLVGLPFGAELLVDNASAIARELNVRDELIGLTIVAIGTSLPELATVMVAAFRRHAEVALGNVVGSNIFNLLAVGAAAGLGAGSHFTQDALNLDIPVMIFAAIALSIAIFGRWKISRPLGLAFLAVYVSYIGYLASTMDLF